jgi:hypothetical protein
MARILHMIELNGKPFSLEDLMYDGLESVSILAGSMVRFSE